MVFAQQIAKRLVGQLLQRLHGVAPQEMKRVPGLGIKFETFAHGRLSVHDHHKCSGRPLLRAGFLGLGTAPLNASPQGFHEIHHIARATR